MWSRPERDRDRSVVRPPRRMVDGALDLGLAGEGGEAGGGDLVVDPPADRCGLTNSGAWPLVIAHLVARLGSCCGQRVPRLCPVLVVQVASRHPPTRPPRGLRCQGVASAAGGQVRERDHLSVRVRLSWRSALGAAGLGLGAGLAFSDPTTHRAPFPSLVGSVGGVRLAGGSPLIVGSSRSQRK